MGNSINLIILLVIVGIFAYVGWKVVEKLDEGSLININIEGTDITLDPSTQPTDPSRYDVCEAYDSLYAYLIGRGYPHPQTTCTAGGGTWLCDEDHSGCYNYPPDINCSLAVYEASLFYCDSLGATGVCDINNAYCEYS